MVSKIMIIRHAEKPGVYGKAPYSGINALGEPDPASLVTMGWERAGGLVNLFAPFNASTQNPHLLPPQVIYASDPTVPGQYKLQPNGNYILEGTSQRPAQTISALYGKMQPFTALQTAYAADNFLAMISDAISQPVNAVLIAWQHQYILPKKPGDDSLLNQLITQTNSTAVTCPTTAWPADRYDMVIVLDRDVNTGQITSITQVPQMLLFGDLTSPLW